jgi:HEAT repeat protein
MMQRMNNQVKLRLAMLLFVGFHWTAVFATTNSWATAERLTSAADVVLVGSTSSMKLVGRTSVEGVGADVESMDVNVLQVIKGVISKDTLSFTFLLPDRGIGYHAVPPNSLRIVFLRRADTGYIVSNPFQPSAPACAPAPTHNGGASDAVVSHVLSVLTCDHALIAQKFEAVDFLRGETSHSVTSGLLAAFKDNKGDQLTHLAIAAELLRRNEMSALPAASAALEAKSQTVPAFIRENLAFAIESVRDPQAIPVLSTMVRNPDVTVRRSVAQALRNTQALAALKPLSQMLSDPDHSVRYYAVIGLGEITRESDWRPLQETFDTDEKKYVDHWKEWAAQRRFPDR